MTVSNEKLSGDKKQSHGFENHHWSRILREQNLSTLKQNYRPCLAKSQQELKTIQRQRSSENIYERETKKLTNQRNSSKNHNNNNNDSMDDISSKQITPKKLNRDNRYSYNGGMPSATSTNSNTESVFVVDRGVQCGGIYDGTNDNFRKLNPVRTLAFLMKELEIIIGGGRAGEILTEMEDALLRIPVESGQPSHMVTYFFYFYFFFFYIYSIIKFIFMKPASKLKVSVFCIDSVIANDNLRLRMVDHCIDLKLTCF